MSDKIEAFEITDHGIDHAQYFQGVGVAHTEFDAVYLGVGHTTKEAYEDAVDSIASEGIYDVESLPSGEVWIAGGNDNSVVPDDADGEVHCYVSIRVR